MTTTTMTIADHERAYAEALIDLRAAHLRARAAAQLTWTVRGRVWPPSAAYETGDAAATVTPGAPPTTVTLGEVDAASLAGKQALIAAQDRACACLDALISLVDAPERTAYRQKLIHQWAAVLIGISDDYGGSSGDTTDEN